MMISLINELINLKLFPMMFVFTLRYQ